MTLTLLDLTEARRAASREALARNGAELKRTQEALAPQLFSLAGGDPEDAKFRRITSPSTLRDLNPLMHERMQQVCFFLAVTTPFGKRIVEVITSYVVGEGFKAVAEDASVQGILDRFWKDPVNDLDQNLRAWTSELTIFGEPGHAGRRLRIIRRDEDPDSPTFGQLAGDCFYFALNKAKSASRGISELFSLADWIDVFDQMVFDFADKVRFLNAFVWHYVVKGADEKQVEEFKKKVTKSPPRQGGVQVTNDQVEIEARTPQFHGADMHESARMVKLYGLGGAGLPAWFFADPVDANRSTAQEMEGPTGKKLTDRQNVTKAAVARILEFALEQATAHGVLPGSANLAWNLQVPDLSVKDLARASGTLQVTGNALAVAEDRGWIRAETAARAFHLVLSQLGVEVDSQREFQAAQEEM